MSKINNSKPVDHEPAVQGPGDLLRRTRLQSGLAVADVCRHIGITPYTLEALETDNLEVLPSAVFVRGYLRAYCGILKLRPSPVLACFDDHCRYLAQRDAPPPQAPPRRLRGVAASLGTGLMACSLVTWALYADGRGAPGDVTAAGGERTSATVAPAPAGQGVAATAGNLEMRFHGDSWLQVIDANDHILAVDLYRAGAHLNLKGEPPFKITLGHAPGVEISYQGAVVEVVPDPDTLAADITVGR